ncbi:MAG: type II toxin-antitoxin system RelE/ParE family toxin [bacterium]|nr:type II toxin-antitoxin system RelE/ParE family toxin [bacterium]
MRIRFSKSALKFLEKINKKKEEKIRLLLKKLSIAAEEGIIPFKELKIKKLEGKWKGRYRMRTNGIRIIYRIDRENREILVYEIDFRGGAY